MLDKYAEELKRAREEKGISLQQMAAKTRIDLKFLEAIDNGNFSFLPDLYVKAFLKQYAKVVDLDENETIERYEAAKDGKLADKEKSKSFLEQQAEVEKELEKDTISESEQKSDEKSDRKPEKKLEESPVKTYTDVSSPKTFDDSGKKNKMTITIIGSVLATGAVLVVIYLLFFSKASDIVVEEKPYEQILQEKKERFQVDKKEEPQTVFQISDSLLLQITNVDSLDSVWVLLIEDDISKEDFMLYPGRSKTVTAANNFKFTLGNSGVVRLRLNKNLLNFEGRKRSVRHFKVDSSGIERLFSPPNLKID
jgi:transcriptional regulator with XRE-family HTH domain